jgi:hypothetical protein
VVLSISAKRRVGVQQRVSIVHSSSGFGAATTGVSNPKWLYSFPGRLRTLLAATYGDAGTGFVPATQTVHATPAYDPRWAFGGTVSDQSLGWHKAACFRVAGGSGNYVEFTATQPVREFVITTLLGTAGYGQVSIDGGAAVTFRNQAGGTAPTLERQSGFHSGHVVTRVPVTFGTHTVRVWGDNQLDLLGVEGSTGSGGVAVDNPSMNGKSLGSLGLVNAGADDEVGGTYGLPMLDTLLALGPGPVLMGLTSNEYTGGTTSATLRSRLDGAIARVQAAGRSPFLYVQPQPDTALQGGTLTYTDVHDITLAAAAAAGVPVLDQWRLWSSPIETSEPVIYGAGATAGKYADTIHPNDSGAADIATSLRTFLSTQYGI